MAAKWALSSLRATRSGGRIVAPSLARPLSPPVVTVGAMPSIATNTRVERAELLDFVRTRHHLVLVTHLPVRDWYWLGLRLRCGHCGQRYPCPPRRIALSHLDRGESTLDGP